MVVLIETSWLRSRSTYQKQSTKQRSRRAETKRNAPLRAHLRSTLLVRVEKIQPLRRTSSPGKYGLVPLKSVFEKVSAYHVHGGRFDSD